MSVSGERWPPVLNSVEECSHYDPMSFFFKPIPFLEDLSLYPFGDALPLDVCLKFLKQVRNSWGYDVNVVAPQTPFIPITKRLLLSEEDIFQKYVLGDCKDLVCKINNQAEEHGKFYEFDQLKKAVHMPRNRLLLVTFTVREVSSGKLERVRVCIYDTTIIQWFFEDKDQDDEDEDEDEDEGIFWAGPTQKGWF